jgi:preprotein translocase subunit SecE
MKHMSLRVIAVVILAAGALAVVDGSFAFAQNAGAPEQP